MSSVRPYPLLDRLDRSIVLRWTAPCPLRCSFHPGATCCSSTRQRLQRPRGHRCQRQLRHADLVGARHPGRQDRWSRRAGCTGGFAAAYRQDGPIEITAVFPVPGLHMPARTFRHAFEVMALHQAQHQFILGCDLIGSLFPSGVPAAFIRLPSKPIPDCPGDVYRIRRRC